MGDSALSFLRGGMCGLQDEDALRDEEDAGGIEEGMRGEENHIV